MTVHTQSLLLSETAFAEKVKSRSAATNDASAVTPTPTTISNETKEVTPTPVAISHVEITPTPVAISHAEVTPTTHEP